MANETRIPLLDRDQVPPEIGALYDALLQQRGVVPNMFKTVAHAPVLTLGFAALLVMLAAAGWAAVHYRQTVVRLWPASARLYSAVRLPVNLTGIAITNIDLRQELQDGMPVLSVTGDVLNVSNREQPIPKLRVVLLDDSKRELYRWTFDPGIPSLKPGSRRVFDTKLPSPPPDARSE